MIATVVSLWWFQISSSVSLPQLYFFLLSGVYICAFIQIHFDGWSDEYNYWVDADSPDLHPIGWCQKTGHPLQTPSCNAVTHLSTSQFNTQAACAYTSSFLFSLACCPMLYVTSECALGLILIVLSCFQVLLTPRSLQDKAALLLDAVGSDTSKDLAMEHITR